MDLSMLTNRTTMTRINHIIWHTHDYNVIFNDMVLMKWEKINSCFRLKNFITKKMTKDIVQTWFQLLFVIIKINK